MSVPGLCRVLVSQAAVFTVFTSLTTAALLILLAVDHQFGSHAAVFGLVVVAVLTLGSVGVAAAASDPEVHRCRPTAGEHRLRGAFRRQRRPDEPGRPMPRAPGPVI